MTPTEGITSLSLLLDGIEQRRQRVLAEARLIHQQWQALASLGAQRDDHAAALLGKLSRPLADLARFARDIGEQVQAMRDDPFGARWHG